MFGVSAAVSRGARQADDGTVLADFRRDPECFAAVYDAYFTQIHGYVAARLGSTFADDLAAETFLVAFRKRAAFDPVRGQVRPWLFGIATNLIAKHRRNEAAAAALVAAGTGYGLTAARGGPSTLPSTAARSGPSTRATTAAGLTAVHGCPGMYITAGTLERVSGTQLIIQPADDHDHVNRTWRAKPVRVATSSSTVITGPVSGTVSGITDGSQVVVQGTWSGRTLAATQVGIEAALPAPSSFGPPVPPNLRKTGPLSAGAIPPSVTGTVVDAHDGRFTVDTQAPPGLRVQVTTSNSTQVVTKASVSLGQLALGANVVAVGPIGPDGVLTASTVTEPSVMGIVLAGGPAKLRTSGCSAAAALPIIAANVSQAARFSSRCVRSGVWSRLARRSSTRSASAAR